MSAIHIFIKIKGDFFQYSTQSKDGTQEGEVFIVNNAALALKVEDRLS